MLRGGKLNISFSGSAYMNILRKGLFAALAVALTGSALAVVPGTSPLAPGNTVVAGVVPFGNNPGTLLATIASPWSFTTTAGTTSGRFTTAVFQEAGGTLDFYYQVTNDPGSATALARMIAVNFSTFSTSVGYVLDGGATMGGLFLNGTWAPTSADRNASGSVVGFNWDNPNELQPGTISYTMVISTNATAFTAGNVSLIDGGATTVAAFQPTAVPEPATMAALGMGALALIRRKRA